MGWTWERSRWAVAAVVAALLAVAAFSGHVAWLGVIAALCAAFAAYRYLVVTGQRD